MGPTKPQNSSHGVQSRALGHDECNSLSSDANDPNLPPAESFRWPNSSASSRATKRIKRHQDCRTPTTLATEALKPIIISKKHRRSTTRVGRLPLADLVSAQGPGPLLSENSKHRESHTLNATGAKDLPTDNIQTPQHLDSDEESFGGEDIFTSTQQLSELHSKLPRYDFNETTAEF